MQFYYFLAFTSVIVCAQSLDTLPSFIHVCHRSDPKLEQCIIDSVSSLRPKLITGITELNLPPLDPLNVGNVMLSNQKDFKIGLRDVRIYGLGNFQIKNLSAKPKGSEYTFTFDIEIEQIRTEGHYDIDGKFLLLPVKGDGKFMGKYNGLKGAVKIVTEKKSIDGIDRFSMSQLKVKLTIANGTSKLDNLFGNDKALNDAINDTINQNFWELTRNVMPLIERSIEQNLLESGNKFAERFSYDQLLPE